MSLFNVPEEMLASIFKFLPYDEAIRLRKINKRVDTVCRAFKVGTKRPVDMLIINHDATDQWRLVAVKQGTISSENSRLSFSDALDNMFAKTMIYKCELMPYSIAIDDKLMNVFVKNRSSFRHLEMLHLNAATISSIEKLNSFCQSIRRLKKIQIIGRNIDAVCRTRIFQNRKWDSIDIKLCMNVEDPDEQYENASLDDQFFYDAVPNCRKLNISNHIPNGYFNFTIPAIIDVFQIALRNGIKTDWNIRGVDLGELTFEEADELFRGIPDCETITPQGYNGWHVYPLPKPQSKLNKRIKQQRKALLTLHLT